MISADDVDTLLFDVLGTVVDEAGSMRAELADALDPAGAGRQAEALAAAWAGRFAALVSSICEGAPWRSTDDLNAEALTDVLRDGPRLPEATVWRWPGTGSGPGRTPRPRCAASPGVLPSWPCRTATCRC